MKQLDLFAGIGAFSLVASLYGIETTAFVEIDPFCQQVLKSRFEGKIHGNVATFTVNRGEFDIITAGFPCQDISHANPNGRGLAGERSGLFWDVIRIVRECEPRFLILENVAALLRPGGLDRVLCALAQIGYDAEWQTISAASMGAPHKRERVFVIAYPQEHGLQITEFNRYTKKGTDTASFPYCQGNTSTRSPRGVAESRLLRVVHGVSYWMDTPCPEILTPRPDDAALAKARIKALGNSIAPQCLFPVYNRLSELISEGY